MSDNAQPAIVDFLRKQPITDETTVAGLLNNLESAFPENDVDDFAAAMGGARRRLRRTGRCDPRVRRRAPAGSRRDPVAV